MIDKDLNFRFWVAIAEGANGGDKQDHVSQTCKANQENFLELNLGDVWALGHFTAFRGETLSEEEDEIQKLLWNDQSRSKCRSKLKTRMTKSWI